jgi:hypothetical protein
MKYFPHASLTVIAMFCSSCILPIPHKRLQRPGVSSVVIDSTNKRPIQNATVMAEDVINDSTFTDRKGHFTIPPKYGWHGAAVVFPPGPSLFPSMDLPYTSRGIKVSADGYSFKRIEYTAKNPGDEWAISTPIELKKNP